MKISELKGKHDHALTSWLKVIIFSLLMIAPLFASISQWVYVSFNKNAKDSYNAGEIKELYNLHGNESTTENVEYNVIYKSDGTTTTNKIFYKSISIDWTDYGAVSNEYDGFYLTTDGTIYLYLGDNAPSEGLSNTWGTELNRFSFVAKESSNIGANPYATFIEIVYKQEALDNAFYYGVEKMTESDLFNWTQNTTLYTGIKTMTDNLEIQTPAIAILLTYWFILTIIYIIIDIVLKGFTTLTHLIMGAKN